MTDHIQAFDTTLADDGEPSAQIDRLHEQARALLSSDPEQAQTLIAAAKELARSGEFADTPYTAGLAESLIIEADLAARQGDYAAANHCLEEALDLLEGSGQTTRQAFVCSTLAFNHTRLGNHARAMSYGGRGLFLAEESENDQDKVTALNALAAAVSNLGEHEHALHYYDQCRVLNESMQDHVRLASTLNNMAYTHFRAGTYAKAVEHATQGLELAQEHEIPLRTILYLRNNAAHGYRMLGQDDEALRLYRQNMDDLTTHDDSIVRLANLLGTGIIFTRQGKSGEAQQALEAALALGKKVKAQPFYFECHQALANLHEQNGDFEQALDHFRQYHALKESVFDEAARKKARRLQFQHQEEAAEREAALQVEQQAALEAEVAERRKAEQLLNVRLKELNCLTDIGYKIDEAPAVPEFLQWITERVPPAMQFPELCVAAVTYHDEIFGQPEAIDLPSQIVQGIRINEEQVGRIYIAYREKQDFLNEESALMGGIVRRVAGYIENQQLIAQTRAALQEAQSAQRAVQHRADTEKIGTAVSASFLDLPAAEVDSGIDQALEMIGAFAQVDRAYLFLFADDESTMSNTNEWCAPGIEPHIENLQELPTSEFSFLMSYLAELDIFYVPNVADLPEDARVEREEFEREGIQSIICVPLISYGKAIGFIGFDAVTQQTEWHEEDIALLRLVADILVSALRRKEAESTLQQTFDEANTFRQLVLASGQGIGMATLDGTITYANPALLEMLAVETAEELYGRSMFPLYAPEIRAQIQEEIMPTLFEEGQWQGELCLNINGSEVPTYENYFLLRDEQGQPAQFATIIANIAERKQAEEAISKQALELQTVAEVSVAAASIHETDTLLDKVVNLTKERFGLYHAHIYLYNDRTDLLELAAGAGDVGKQQVQQRHSIPLQQQQSIVARAARSQAGDIVNDVHADPGFLPNPLLPDTQAEMAIPLVFGGQLLGVLDIQSDHRDAFTRDDIAIQTTLATQVAIALENARSFEQSQNALQELDLLTRRLTREGWNSYLMEQDKATPGFVFDGLAAQPIPVDEITAEAVPSNGEVWQQDLTIHGQPVGQLTLVPDVEETDGLDEDAAALVAAVADQLSARIENIRLTEQTQLALATTEAQAERLSRLNDMAAALNAAQEIDDVYQIATDDTLRILDGDRASVTLLNNSEGTLTVLAVSGDARLATVGLAIPLDKNSVMTQAVREQRVVVQPHTDAKKDGDIVDAIVAPIFSGGQVIGTLNVGSMQTHHYDANDENLIRQITALLASTIENRRLLSETRARAEQLAVINRISQTLSQYLEQEPLLNAAYEEIKGVIPADSFYVSLYTPETSELRYPILYEGGVLQEQAPVTLSKTDFSYRVINERKPVLRHLTPAEADEIREKHNLIGNTEDDRMPPSLIYVPLLAGRRVLGVLSAQSYQYNAYSESDVSLLSGVAGYLAVALENVRFLTEAQQRAEQLQKLSEIEVALSQAVTEEDILTATLQSFDAPDAIMSASLNYIYTDEKGQPHQQRLVANWLDGSLDRESPFMHQPLPLAEYAVSQLWLSDPNNPLLMADVAQDERVDADLTKDAAAFDFSAIAIIPLRSAGRWQGNISILWNEPHAFSESEEFLLDQLVEPVAAVVASRRAQVAQEEALALTDNLYRASRRINAAGPDLQEALAGLSEAAAIVAVNRVLLFQFGHHPDGTLKEITAVANWYGGHGPQPSAIGTTYAQEQLKALSIMLTTEPLIFNDTATEKRLDPATRAAFKHLLVPSAVVLPLWVGDRQLGSILLETAEPYAFAQAELEPYIALASQLAVAVDRQRLLRQAEARAERERRIRTITDKIRRGTDREAILRVARQEIGQLLGVSATVAHVGTRDQLLQRMQRQSIADTQNDENQEAVSPLSTPPEKEKGREELTE